jgi:RNA-directed DNA polymerase
LLVVSGTREHAEHMRERAAAVLAPMGLRLSAEKTTITHIDEGLDFLGWRIQRHRKRRTNRHYVYTLSHPGFGTALNLGHDAGVTASVGAW